MELTNSTQTTARKYNIDPREVIFARLLATGTDRAEAYYFLYHRGTRHLTADQANNKAQELLDNNPGLKILIQKIKSSKHLHTVNQEAKSTIQNEINNEKKKQEEEKENYLNSERGKKYTDKSYIIAELSLLAESATGKDKKDILMSIADLQRMKQDEIKADEERRKFYLPYISHCRTCKIMALFKEFQDKVKENASDA